MLRRATKAMAPLMLLAWAQPASAAPRVVVTIKPLHGLVAEVMAGVGSPRMLVKGAASPHVYALKPSDIGELNGCRHLLPCLRRNGALLQQDRRKLAPTRGAW